MNIFKGLKYQIWSVLWTIIIIIFCTIRMPDTSGSGITFFEGFDKLAHLGFFYVLTILLFFGKIRQQQSYSFRMITILKIVFLTGLLGAGIELIQANVFTYRSGDLWDLTCDMLGVFMGVFSYILLHRSNYNEKRS
ncbi:VanZ family protein [Pedobacter metabolipauper]|uniref:VanZ like protein n=1 Tax=Pedobacter metabolipauper TaxID=425513 RepID=A0A4R6SZE8_9SPHI|nr:VanZ family protein [Pedobacter metabolipauper]TDQ10074.1 VanZ like protein [Pedobacter metabolipauper]